MFIVQDILISAEIFTEAFLCNLKACKGACCWEGDYGAPLDPAELPILEKIYPDIRPFLSKEGIAVLETEGKYTYYEDTEDHGTPLVKSGACAYMTYNEDGIAQCGIEKAYQAGATDFLKPVSCHLYPIRITQKKETGFEALNYHRWEICSAACTMGKEKKMPVYRFVKNALIRKYGQSFFEELEAAAKHHNRTYSKNKDKRI